MNESDLRTTLLLQAFEALPPDDTWPERDRAMASQAGLEAIRTDRQQADAEPSATSATSTEQPPQAEIFFAARARAAQPQLLKRDSEAARTFHALAWRRWIPPLIILGALLLGVLSEAIGSQRQINLLAPPLIGLLVWHAGLYLVMLASGVVPLFRRNPANQGWFRSAVARLAQAGSISESLSERARAFAGQWLSASAPLTTARTATTLHLAAVALATGTVVAMYARGLAFEYSAGWESTFFNAGQVTALLHGLLTPASILTGISLPSANEIDAIAFANGSGENAARWIHLWACTIGLFVIVPRALMALFSGLQAKRLSRALPYDFSQPYFDGLQRLLTGKAAGLLIVPYATVPEAAACDAMLTSFRRLYGARANVEIAPTVPFGDEDDYTPHASTNTAELTAVLFSLSATPERENQGEFVIRVNEGLGPDGRLLVLIDEQAFRTRFAGNPERLAQRQAAWQKLLTSLGWQAVFIRLDPAQIEHNVAALQAVLTTRADPGRPGTPTPATAR